MDFVSALNILVAVSSDSSYALIVGALLAGYWLHAVTGPPVKQVTASLAGPVMRRVGMMSLTVLIVCHLVRPWFVASSMSGSTEFRAALALVPTILSSTRQGGLWYTNSVTLVVLFAAQSFIKARAPSIGRWLEMTTLCLLAATKAASTHASEEGDLSPAEISEFFHLLATSVWAGAIIVSGLVVVPRLTVLAGAPALWSYGGRLSKTVTLALGVLTLSGMYTAWRDMHSHISALWISPWGKILLTKVALVGVAVLLGGSARFRCLRRPATSDRATALSRLLRSEATVMVAILCVSGVLANTSPGI